MYTVCKVKKYSLPNLLKVSDILYDCGKDMAQRNDLHHWDNSHLKTWIIVLLCAMKNNIYLVLDGNKPIATFQTKKIGNAFSFQKLATSPATAGRGVGSFCMAEIERMAKEAGCVEVICEVYDRSEHAKSFYEHRGYLTCGTIDTLKYKELKLKKKI